jgi:hypothetical protein
MADMIDCQAAVLLRGEDKAGDRATTNRKAEASFENRSGIRRHEPKLDFTERSSSATIESLFY